MKKKLAKGQIEEKYMEFQDDSQKNLIKKVEAAAEGF